VINRPVFRLICFVAADIPSDGLIALGLECLRKASDGNRELFGGAEST
jgi:hypothetical protein